MLFYGFLFLRERRIVPFIAASAGAIIGLMVAFLVTHL